MEVSLATGKEVGAVAVVTAQEERAMVVAVARAAAARAVVARAPGR